MLFPYLNVGNILVAVALVMAVKLKSHCTEYNILTHTDVITTDLFCIFKLAGDKEDRDAKLKKMTEELKKLKDKLGKQERLEDEVYTSLHIIYLVCVGLLVSHMFSQLIIFWQFKCCCLYCGEFRCSS